MNPHLIVLSKHHTEIMNEAEQLFTGNILKKANLALDKYLNIGIRSAEADIGMQRLMK